MAYAAEVICDSLAPCDKRLTTVVATYPRFVHSELLTHRMLSRNSASSRAIPWEKKLKAKRKNIPPACYIYGNGQFSEISLNPEEEYEYLHPKCMKNMILMDPVIPLHWGQEQKGMQSGEAITDCQRADSRWLAARNDAVRSAESLAELGVHKSLCNRLTEPWMWITVVISATEWNNFFHLRCHPAAEVHIQKIAYMIRDTMVKSAPRKLEAGDWHLPFIDDDDWKEVTSRSYNESSGWILETIKKMAVGRCARVSYLNHDGKKDIADDLALFARLAIREVNIEDPMHSSPLECVAQALSTPERSGNFIGFHQFRKDFPLENKEG